MGRERMIGGEPRGLGVKLWLFCPTVSWVVRRLREWMCSKNACVDVFEAL